jgi:hypothetical protein
MVTAAEAVAASAEANAKKEMEKKREQAKPTMSFLHHIAATQAMQTGFTVTLTDGTSYKAASGDFVFTDGISIVHEGHRIYFPTTSIKSVLIHNPNEK